MTVEKRPDGSLRLQDRFAFLRWSLVVLALLFVALGLLLVAAGDPFRRILGPLVGALFCAGLSALLEDSEMDLDAGARQVRWRKSQLFGRREGTLPFEAVEKVVMEVRLESSESGRSVSRNARLFLLAGGERISLGSGNRNLDPDWARREVGQPVLALLGKSELAEEGFGARLSWK